jgi:hypothetical protein
MFSTAGFLLPFSLVAKNFRHILNIILIGLYEPIPVVKKQTGFWGSFF